MYGLSCKGAYIQYTRSGIGVITSGSVDALVLAKAIGAVAPDENYNFAHFKYDESNDTYTCQQQQILTSNGSWYQKNKERYFYLARYYKTYACTTCTARISCTKNQKSRVIERSEYAPYMKINKCNIEANSELYKKRQSLVEHPYGTIKRQWRFYYIITKRGLKRASADVGFMFVAQRKALTGMGNFIDTLQADNSD